MQIGWDFGSSYCIWLGVLGERVLAQDWGCMLFRHHCKLTNDDNKGTSCNFYK